MPTFNFACPCGREWEAYIHNHMSENPLCECGEAPERVWRLGTKHVGASTFPFITTHLNPSGAPVEVTSQSHLDRLCKEFGVTHRPDVAWATEEYQGVNFRTGEQNYKRGNGVGLPGCWV